MNVPQRYRLPIAILVSLAVVLLVFLAVTIVSQPRPNGTSSPSPTASAPTDPTSTPEGAVRAMFEAFAKGRPTNDPSFVLPFVTSEESSAFLSVRGFLEGQQGLGRGAVITEQRFGDLSVEIDQETATVTFTYTETGYLIDVDTREPLGSPAATAPARVVAQVVLRGSKWLVEEYESTS